MNGKTTRLTDSVFTSMPMDLDMKATGKMINSMDKVMSLGLMEANTLVNMLTQRNTAKVNIYGQMVTDTSVTGVTMPLMEKVSISGLMADLTVDNGRTT